MVRLMAFLVWMGLGWWTSALYENPKIRSIPSKLFVAMERDNGKPYLRELVEEKVMVDTTNTQFGHDDEDSFGL